MAEISPLRRRMIEDMTIHNPFTATNCGNAVLATQPLKHNADFVLGRMMPADLAPLK